MKKSLLAITLALLLVGCGEETQQEDPQKDEKAIADQETKAGQEIKETKKEEAPKKKEKEQKKVEVNSKATKELKSYLDPGFSSTSWFTLIEGVKVKEETVIINTSVYPDSEGKEAVKNIPTTIWGWANSSDYEIKDVIIKDQNGNNFVREVNPAW